MLANTSIIPHNYCFDFVVTTFTGSPSPQQEAANGQPADGLSRGPISPEFDSSDEATGTKAAQEETQRQEARPEKTLGGR